MTKNQGYVPVDTVMWAKLQGSGLDSHGLICLNGSDCVHNDHYFSIVENKGTARPIQTAVSVHTVVIYTLDKS